MSNENLEPQATWTVRQEVTEVLRRRRTLDEQFRWIKSFYNTEIQKKMEKFKVDEETVIGGYYLAREIMAQVGEKGAEIADEATFQREILSDDARVEKIIETIFEAQKYYGSGKKVQDIAAQYQVIYDIAVKVLKNYTIQKRVHTLEKVIAVNLTDSFLTPTFDFFAESFPDMDFRWLLAEIEAFMRKDFPMPFYKAIVEIGLFPATFDRELFFEAGLWVVKRYIAWSKRLVEEKDTVVLQDVGKKPYTYATSTFYSVDTSDYKLLAKPLPTDDNESKPELLDTATQFMLMNHSVINHSSYNLKYVRAQTLIGEKSNPVRRMCFAVNELQQNYAVWQKILLHAEDVNISLVSTYLRERCQNIRGSLKLFKKGDDIPLLSTLQYFDEATVNYTEEGHDYVGTEDKYREMNYIPIATFNIKSKDAAELLLRTKPYSPFQSTTADATFIPKDEVDNLLKIIDKTVNLLHSEANIIYNSRGEAIDIIMYPLEALFVNKQDSQNVLLYVFDFDDELNSIIGIIAKNMREDSQAAFAKRTIHRKLSTIISGLHVKGSKFLDVVDAKMGEDTMTKKTSRSAPITPLWMKYSANSGQLKKDAKESKQTVSEEYSQAMTQAQMELQQYQRNYFEEIVVTNFIKLLTLRFNEILLQATQNNGQLTTNQLDKLKASFERQMRGFIPEYIKEVPKDMQTSMEEKMNGIKPLMEQIAALLIPELLKAYTSIQKLSKEEIQNLLLGSK